MEIAAVVTWAIICFSIAHWFTYIRIKDLEAEYKKDIERLISIVEKLQEIKADKIDLSNAVYDDED